MLASGKCGNFLDGIHLSYLSLSFVHDTGFPEPVAAYPEVFFLLIRRGFVDAVRCYPDDWAHRGDEILSRQPVRYVDIIQYPEVAGDYRDGMSILILRANDQEVITMPNENPRLNIGGREYEIAARRLMEKRWPNVEIRLPPRSSPIIRPYWDDEPAGANLANAFNALSRYSHESGVGHIGAR
jgi:hypothetical protein